MVAEKYKKLSLIIPVFNEESTIEKLLKKVIDAKLGILKEIIVIDDASTDSTSNILNKFNDIPGLKILKNEQNMGKSLTVKHGIELSTGDLVVIQDADLEYNPQNLSAFVKKFNESDADIIYGDRFSRGYKIVYPVVWVGNVLLSVISGLITGLRARMWVHDAHVCYKMVKGGVIRSIAPKLVSTSGFGFDTEITAKLSKFKLNGKHLKLSQLPVEYYPRTMGQGKKLRPISDGFKALWEIFKFNFLIR